MSKTVKFLLTWLLFCVLWSFAARMINGVILFDDWGDTAPFRPWEEELKRYHFLRLAYVFYSGAALWIFVRFVASVRGRWWHRGLEVGACLALLTYVPANLIGYTTLPLPGLTLVKQSLWFFAFLLACGVLLAFIYRREIERP